MKDGLTTERTLWAFLAAFAFVAGMLLAPGGRQDEAIVPGAAVVTECEVLHEVSAGTIEFCPAAPAPSATPTATLTPSPTPTATPEPPTPTATATAAPTATPVPPTATPTPPTPSAGTSVKDFGATGDGVADDTAELRAALQSGDPLVFPAGDYRITGELLVGSGARLTFEPGARIVHEGLSQVIRLVRSTDVEIDGLTVYVSNSHHPGGPNPIRLEGASFVTLRNITLERTHSWGLYILSSGGQPSHDILIDGFVNTNRLTSGDNRNIDDGADLIGYNITLRNFFITTFDDGVSIKTLGGTATHDILLENGVIRSRDACLTIGSIIARPVERVTVRNVRFEGCGEAIFIKTDRMGPSGRIDDVLFEDVVVEGSRIRHFTVFDQNDDTGNGRVNGIRFVRTTFTGLTVANPPTGVLIAHQDLSTWDFSGLRINGSPYP